MWFTKFMKNLKTNFRNISLHGCFNVSESKSVLETTFWLCVQVFCFILCLWLMKIHWLRYQSRPTITTIKSTAFPVSDIPFPAVTVCNSNVVHKKNMQFYENILKNEGYNVEEIQYYFTNLKYLIHSNPAPEINVTLVEQIENVLLKHNITNEQLMKNVTHKCSEMISNCIWAGTKYNCSHIFRLIKTSMGYCCSFNYFNDEISILDGFSKPYIADGAGMSHGLSITLDIGAEDYVSSVLPFFACFVIIHSVWDYSDISEFSVTLQPGDFVLMQIIPTVYTAEENLRDVGVPERNCWFETEGYLQTTKAYSFTNCIVECKETAIWNLCNCIPFYYNYGDRRQCSLQDLPCLKQNELIYNNIKLSDKMLDNSTTCNCLPQCQDISYEGYVNSIKSGMAGNSSIFIYFDRAWCVEYNKSLNLTWDMLLASLGGIFGLCLGGSLISLVECVFYLIKSIVLTFIENKQMTVKNKKNVVRFIQVKSKY